MDQCTPSSAVAGAMPVNRTAPPMTPAAMKECLHIIVDSLASSSIKGQKGLPRRQTL
jgi:hypothetical protein